MDLDRLSQDGLAEIAAAHSAAELEDLKVRYFGKKGVLTDALKALGTLSAEERPIAGARIHKIKDQLTHALEAKAFALDEQAIQEALLQSGLDVTLPGRGLGVGALHPITRTRLRIEEIFIQAGFSVAKGPEIEDDYHNFEALNIPANHPARAMHDTFYFGDGSLLRTHTSPVQVREMQKAPPPYRLIMPGRVYRNDSDQTHTPMFHQVEGLVIDKAIGFAHLKSVLKQFVQAFFEKPLNIRLRPSYFPFTEPSAEVDCECVFCEGKGCRVCKHTGWLEVLGCGCVHPNVLRHGGLDPEEWCGYAFGMGIERLAMLRYQVNDLRQFFENDSRFLDAFKRV